MLDNVNVLTNQIQHPIRRPELQGRIRWLWPLVVAVRIAFVPASGASRQLQLEIQPEWNGIPSLIARPESLRR